MESYDAYRAIDWVDFWREASTGPFKHAAGSEESRKVWNEKAAGFTHKRKRSDYIDQLIALLALKPGESVLDAGCGPGTLGVPLAQAGHEIVALDFSPAMLEELEHAAAAAQVRERFQVFERSWQQSWDDIPCADVAVSSRSLITEDLADSIAKLESHARSRVVISTGAGDIPYRDHRILAAMGRSPEEYDRPRDLIALVNYLFSHARYPRIEYIETEGKWARDTREELEQAVIGSHQPKDAAEEAALRSFLAQHIVCNEEREQFELDYPRVNSWAYVEWRVLPDFES